MENQMTAVNARKFLLGMVAYWLVFGLICTFEPGLMDMFQTPAGIAAKTDFSTHVWTHDGLDILAICALVFAISRTPLTPATMRAVGLAAMLPTIGIFYSLAATPYWNPMFIGAGVGCLAFALGALYFAKQ